MKLLKYESYNITFEPEILTLKPFKTLHKRDKTKDKNKFIQELGFIYFFCDARSDYQYLTNEEYRRTAILEGEGMPLDWKPDEAVQEAMDFYNTFKPTSALLLEDTRIAIDKLRSLLKNINLDDRDDKGKPIYTLNTFTSTINQIPTLVKNLNEAERAINKEIFESNKVRGAQEKSMYEDM